MFKLWYALYILLLYICTNYKLKKKKKTIMKNNKKCIYIINTFYVAYIIKIIMMKKMKEYVKLFV